jgi:multicomponent Na+:H+ antiporter subunit C
MSLLLEHYNYAVVIILMMTGLYVVFASSNMIKKLVGLSVFQTSVFLLYISIGKVTGGQPPIIILEEHHDDGHAVQEAAHGAGAEIADAGHGTVEAAHSAADVLYSNPLPHVLILTAIVVGVATLAIGLALVVRTREAYGTIDAYEIDELDYQINIEGIET